MIKIHSCFEDDIMVIIELSKAEDHNHNWLHYVKTTGEFFRLWLRNFDFANDVAEYYFEQGFLKVRDNTAVFIEKFNFQQHTLRKSTPGTKILSVIETYTGKISTQV